MNRPLIFLIVFVAASLLYLVTVDQHLHFVQLLTKPLIVMSLMGYYLSTTSRLSTVFLLALGFCCMGDTLLLFESSGQVFFLLGLASFLLGHLFFILSYRSHRDTEIGESPTQKLRLAFPVLLAGTGLTVILFPVLGNLRAPVVIYSFVITMMVITSVLRMGRTSWPSFWYVFFGSLLFMLSDSVLAVNRFLSPIAQAGYIIMISYCAAQFMIVKGILLHQPTTNGS